ncbi:MAG: hypothetical protein MUE98_12740 [Rhodobacteraceae bacterium]|jgi:hypothetical protein|nr:hypothetical protein [Paracoccaceae bacterium]
MIRTALALALLLAPPAAAQAVKYGDDSGDYPFDNECDDRRFYGTAMASRLDWTSVGRDATDCRALLEAGRVALWDIDAARAATQCEAVKWGDDSSEYAGDGTCDDPRFEGVGAADLLLPDDSGRDATDCRRMCEYGQIYLRDY